MIMQSTYFANTEIRGEFDNIEKPITLFRFFARFGPHPLTTANDFL